MGREERGAIWRMSELRGFTANDAVNKHLAGCAQV